MVTIRKINNSEYYLGGKLRAWANDGIEILDLDELFGKSTSFAAHDAEPAEGQHFKVVSFDHFKAVGVNELKLYYPAGYNLNELGKHIGGSSSYTNGTIRILTHILRSMINECTKWEFLVTSKSSVDNNKDAIIVSPCGYYESILIQKKKRESFVLYSLL